MKNVYYTFLVAMLMVLQVSFVNAQQDTVVAWNFPLNPDNSIADGGVAANLTKTLVVRGGTSAVDFSNVGFSTNAANATGWNAGMNAKYWMIGFETSGFSSLMLSSKQRSANTGPRDFKIQYTLDTNSAWTDVTGTYAVMNNWTTGFTSALALPVACTNQPLVFVRWIMTSDINVTGGAVDLTGSSRIDDILITGSSDYMPVYAALPYQMTFENLWINGNDTMDVPSVNWLNTPPSGIYSWRRNDNISTWNSGAGDYTPTGALSSTYSARFHTWDVPAGGKSSFDLYVNCSTPGMKSLSFYYINPTGSDRLTVLYSINGGVSFTPLDSVGAATVWTRKTISLGTGTSGTCVVRFTGTSDYGMDDIGLDYVTVGPPAALDAGISAIVAPGSTIPNGNTAVKVNLKNFGATNLTSVSICWSIDGVAQTAFPWGGTLTTGSVDDSVTIGSFIFTGGVHTIKVYTALPNGGTDADNTNDTLQKTITVSLFAGIPLYEGFDGTWINKSDTLDVPNLFWNNSPSAGNNSWRRDDEGLSGDWTAELQGSYSPTGAFSTTHSAKFHTYFASNGTQGIFDLSVNLSPAGVKNLSYYYINADGADQLQVLISTNGGSSFSVLSTHGVVNLWTKFVINLGSINAANSIIRFVATSDFGNTDIGLDEVRIDLAGHDIEVSSITAPVSGCSLGNAEPVVVNIRNLGFADEHQFPVSYKINGNTVTETFTDTIAPGNTGTYVFAQTANLSALGSHTITAYCALTGDIDLSNDTIFKEVLNILPISSFPFLEDFEGSNAYLMLKDTIQSYAAVENGKGTGNSRGLRLTGGQQGIWAAGTGTTTTHNEAWVTYTEHHAKAFTCAVDATTLTAPELKIDLRQTNTAGILYSWFRVMLNDTVQLSDTSGTFDFNPVTYNTDPFKTLVFDLQAYAGTQFVLSLQASCKYDSTFDAMGDNAFVDNIIIRNRPNADLMLSQWISPIGGGCGMGSDSIRISIKNVGVSTQSNIPLAYSINDGASWISDTAHITLIPGDTAIFTFTQPANFSTPGTYHCLAALCTVLDEDPLNDTIGVIVNSIPLVNTFPYAQNFENPFSGWTSGSLSGSDLWELGTPDKVQLSSAHSGTNAWVTLLSGPYPDSQDCYILSPCLDFSSLTDPQLSVWLNINTEAVWDAMIMETSVNDSLWVHYATDSLFYNDLNNWGPVVAPKWSGSNGGWTQYKTAMQGFAGLDNVKIRFRFIADNSVNSEGIAIDDIFISDPIPYNAAVINITAPQSSCGLGTSEIITVTVKNAGTQSINNIPVSYSVDGGSWVGEVIAGPLDPDSTLSYSFTTGADFSAAGLHSCEVAVSLATDPDFSNDTLMSTVSTLAPIEALPYTEDLDAGNQSFDLAQNYNAMADLQLGEGTLGSTALHFTGGDAGSWPGGTGTSTTSAQAWDFYTDHHATATTCAINLPDAQTLFLSFTLRQTHSGGPNYSWFRVMLNGSALLSDTNGMAEFHPYTEAFDSAYTVVYNITTALGAPFYLSLQACNKYSPDYAPNGIGDNVFIDDIMLYDTATGSSIRETAIALPVLFPNPASEEVFVNFGSTGNNGSYVLYDMNGKRVLNQEYRVDNLLNIDLHNLPKGLYFLIINNDEHSWKYKIIKD